MAAGGAAGPFRGRRGGGGGGIAIALVTLELVAAATRMQLPRSLRLSAAATARPRGPKESYTDRSNSSGVSDPPSSSNPDITLSNASNSTPKRSLAEHTATPSQTPSSRNATSRRQSLTARVKLAQTASPGANASSRVAQGALSEETSELTAKSSSHVQRDQAWAGPSDPVPAAGGMLASVVAYALLATAHEQPARPPEQGARALLETVHAGGPPAPAADARGGGGGDAAAPQIAGRVTVLLLVTVVLVLVGITAIGRLRHGGVDSLDAGTEARRRVRSLEITSGDKIKRSLRHRTGYDCLLLQPQAAAGVTRLEGTVLASPRAVLQAPLARCGCVLFSASAAEIRLDSVRAPPVAFCAMSSDFEVVPWTAGSELRVRVCGRHVVLFDTTPGSCQHIRTSLSDAPAHLRDFVRAHRTTAAASADASAVGGAVLEFTECMLAVGAVVTCVGELRREPTGELGLWPLQQDLSDSDHAPDALEGAGPARQAVPGLTSWERVAEPGSDARLEKVMISDDPRLLGSVRPAAGPGVAAQLCERVACGRIC